MMNALDLWKAGWNTLAIAKRLKVDESVVYNELAACRDREYHSKHFEEVKYVPDKHVDRRLVPYAGKEMA